MTVGTHLGSIIVKMETSKNANSEEKEMFIIFVSSLLSMASTQYPK